MKSSKDVEKVLERFGGEWPNNGSIVDRVMHEIESAPVVTISPNRRRIYMKSIVGIAACLAVAIMVWLVPFFFALTPSVTLAQVEAAVAKQKWLHVKYDTGGGAGRRWTAAGSLSRRRMEPLDKAKVEEEKERLRCLIGRRTCSFTITRNLNASRNAAS